MPRQPQKKSMRPRASLQTNGKPFPKAQARPQRKRPAPGMYNVDDREKRKVDSEAELDPKARSGRRKDYRDLADIDEDEMGAEDNDEDADEARGGGGHRGPVGKWVKYPGAEAELWAALRKFLPSGASCAVPGAQIT